MRPLETKMPVRNRQRHAITILNIMRRSDNTEFWVEHAQHWYKSALAGKDE